MTALKYLPNHVFYRKMEINVAIGSSIPIEILFTKIYIYVVIYYLSNDIKTISYNKIILNLVFYLPKILGRFFFFSIHRNYFNSL